MTVDLAFENPSGLATDEDFDDFVDRFLDELDNLVESDPGIVDPDVAGSLAQRTITVTMGVEAGTVEDGARLFFANVRCALHAAESATPNWPTFAPSTPMSPGRVGLVDA
nr:hypothetical protein [Nocardiopsis algeriensis]